MHRFNDSKVVLVGTSLSISDRKLFDFLSAHLLLLFNLNLLTVMHVFRSNFFHLALNMVFHMFSRSL